MFIKYRKDSFFLKDCLAITNKEYQPSTHTHTESWVNGCSFSMTVYVRFCIIRSSQGTALPIVHEEQHRVMETRVPASIWPSHGRIRKQRREPLSTSSLQRASRTFGEITCASQSPEGPNPWPKGGRYLRTFHPFLYLDRECSQADARGGSS